MITFHNLTFCNFLSVGNTPVTVELDKDKTTLIHGVNGSGKSTVLDVLTYCLFNKPFRQIRLPQLINTTNKKGLLTEVVFSIGRDKYIVRRGTKPKVFEIYKNGERLLAKAADKDNQQHLEQNILKLTYKSFTQIVILGSSSYVPFMQLPANSRRECVEDFLDIKVFSTMAIIAKERLRSLKDRVDDLENDIHNVGYKMDVQNAHIHEMEKHTDSNIKEVTDEIDRRSSVVEKLSGLVSSLRITQKNTVEIAQQELADNPQKKLKQLNDIQVQMKSKIDRMAKDIEFFETAGECPTCSQTISEDTAKTMITKSEKDIEQVNSGMSELFSVMKGHEDTMRVVSGRQKYVQALQQSMVKYDAEIDSNRRELASLNTKLTSLQGDTSSIDGARAKVELLEEDLSDLQRKVKKTQQDVVEHETIVSMLKDGGIKTQIVKKYLPVMNNFIRKYLTDLEFPIHFTLDEEFDETVASPMHQDFSYASFSEGQKSRIDLALMMTWREVGKLKNSVRTNLLVLDEVFSSSLDETGKSCLLNIIRYGLEDTNVFVIDHTLSDSFKDKFDTNIEVSRQKGFSLYN